MPRPRQVDDAAERPGRVMWQLYVCQDRPSPHTNATPALIYIHDPREYVAPLLMPNLRHPGPARTHDLLIKLRSTHPSLPTPHSSSRIPELVPLPLPAPHGITSTEDAIPFPAERYSGVDIWALMSCSLSDLLPERFDETWGRARWTTGGREGTMIYSCRV